MSKNVHRLIFYAVIFVEGEGEETPHHILTECPAYGKLRLEIFNKLDITTEDIPFLKGKDIVRFARGTGRWTDR